MPRFSDSNKISIYSLISPTRCSDNYQQRSVQVSLPRTWGIWRQLYLLARYSCTEAYWHNRKNRPARGHARAFPCHIDHRSSPNSHLVCNSAYASIASTALALEHFIKHNAQNEYERLSVQLSLQYIRCIWRLLYLIVRYSCIEACWHNQNRSGQDYRRDPVHGRHWEQFQRLLLARIVCSVWIVFLKEREKRKADHLGLHVHNSWQVVLNIKPDTLIVAVDGIPSSDSPLHIADESHKKE